MKPIVLIIFFGAFTNAVQGQRLYWQQQVNYSIDVRLNDNENSLNGFVKIDYTNNSPDTLSFIWFHVWPNAYKNDKTAFSEQLLVNGRTDFYFSNKADKGYINQLNFKVNNVTARQEDHPQYIDVIKLILPEKLLPGKTTTVTTPFYVKLPKNFSRSGHVYQSYQVTQWYPKPAVYDNKGWHPIPYLEQGEFYSEFGNYDVRISVPDNYVVAATGELKDENEQQWLENRKNFELPPLVKSVAKTNKKKKPGQKKEHIELIPSSSNSKTLNYYQENVHDFAWFADKYLRVLHDTLQLASGKIINLYSYFPPKAENKWGKSIRFLKEAILFHSANLGEYPYNVASAVEVAGGAYGGMEYPTITSLTPMNNESELAHVIEHEVGHNWFYGILANNEREHAWMDEGMNSYYNKKFMSSSNSSKKKTGKPSFFNKREPDDKMAFLLNTCYQLKKDQPIETPSHSFSETNYRLIAYSKAADWMQKLEFVLGKDRMDSCMKMYYQNWKFKHPYPEDFKQIIEHASNTKLDTVFNNLYQTGPLMPRKNKKTTAAFLFNLKNTDRKNYLSFSPMVGFNIYDGAMVGGLIHNYQLPLNQLQWIVAPLYATSSKKINGLARISYSWFPYSSKIYKAELGMGAARFTGDRYRPVKDSTALFLSFFKLAPFIRVTLKNNNPLSPLEQYVQWKTYFISEEALKFQRIITPTDTLRKAGIQTFDRYINQLKLVVENSRALYPYRAELQLEQGKGFLRTAFTGNYLLNYPIGDGARVRFFAAKFSYLGRKTAAQQLETSIYHPKLTAVRGYDDYTYSNYFLGRNGVGGQEVGLADQQMMLRDGGLKIRTDIFSGLQGRSDNWVAAFNLSTPLPLKALPSFVSKRFRLFFDVGTYAEAWSASFDGNRFLYTGGLQLSLFHDVLNVYYPLVFNKEIRDNLKSVPTEYKKRISFSIDIQNFRLSNIARNSSL